MSDVEEKEKTEEQPDEQSETFFMLIPQCCREQWDTCPHVVNRDNYKVKRKNIAL